jgi:signal transduction histidine kinase
MWRTEKALMEAAHLPGTILVVDDQEASVDLLINILENRGYRTHSAFNGKDALQLVSTTPVDLILLDVSMPGMDGYEVCQHLKADDRLRDIPVLFVSAINDLRVKVEGFRVGGLDYITKPFYREELLARVNTHLDLRHKQAEIARLRQLEVARLQQTNDFKDTVLQMVSHDLKSPLTALKSGLSVLELILGEAISSNVRTINAANIIRRSTNKMIELVRDVLDLARAEGRLITQYEITSMTPYLRQRIDEAVIVAADKQIEVRFDAPPEDVQVALAPSLFSLVVENLLSNAIKYTPVGGHVTLTLRADDHDVIIRVQDDGKGIPDDAIPHLFEKFYRVDEDQAGTGLGLTIAKTIVDQHQGRISVQSEVGKGTCFTVALPYAVLPRVNQPATG